MRVEKQRETSAFGWWGMTSQHTQVDLLAVLVGLEGFSDTCRD